MAGECSYEHIVGKKILLGFVGVFFFADAESITFDEWPKSLEETATRMGTLAAEHRSE